MPYAKLRGKIKEKYNTVENCAKACNFSRYQLDSRLAGRVAISIDEMLIMANALDIPEKDLGLYFFNK